MNSLRLSRLVLFVFGLFGLFGLFNFTPALRAQQLPPARETQTQSSQNTFQRASSKRSPIFFVENVGQFTDARVKFQAQLGSSILTVRNKSLVLSVLEPLAKRQRKPNTTPPTRQGVNLNLKFVGANQKIKIVPSRRVDTRMSFYLGDDPANWRADVPVWEGVRLKNIYPKIDLILTSNAGRFTPRLVARKGADLSQVKLRIQGAQELELAKNGIRVKTQVRAFTLPFFRVVHKANPNPKLPQASVDGDVVTAPFTTKAASKESNAELDDDTAYQTLFGGGVLDFSSDIAVDSAGNAYVAGLRYSADFESDGFVVKLDPVGTVVQTTLFGGSDSDDASGIVVDADGNVFVSGSTFSSDFAGGGNPYDYDGFVVKVNASGGLDWAQRLGGTDLDFANGLDWNGASLLVGGSSSSSNWGAVSEGSGYLIEVDGNGGVGAPEFLNLGAEGTYVSAVTVSSSTVWVTGASSSEGNAQGFVRNRSSGQTQTFGGSGNESPDDIAVDAGGNAYVVGSTDSTDWAGYHPGDCIGPDSTLPCHDVFVLRLGADGALTTQLFGGSGDDWGNGIAVNGQGEVLVAGDNGSSDWLTPYYGDGDGFVLQLNSSLTPTWTRVIGGSSFDGAGGIVVDASGAVYVTGHLSDGEDTQAYAMKLEPPADFKPMNVYIVVYEDQRVPGAAELAENWSDQLIITLTAGTRYHGYSNASAAPYLSWRAYKTNPYDSPIHLISQPVPKMPGQTNANYEAIFDQLPDDLCGLINAGQVQEVWLWGPGDSGFDEHIEIGPPNGYTPRTTGLFVNNPKDCTSGDGRANLTEKQYAILGFNYQYPLQGAFESYMHRMEFSFNELFPCEFAVSATYWNNDEEARLAAREVIINGERKRGILNQATFNAACAGARGFIARSKDGTPAQCGIAHFPPNVKWEDEVSGWWINADETIEYTGYNRDTLQFQTGCNDWVPDPNAPQSVTPLINCLSPLAWECAVGDRDLSKISFVRWWMQNIPARGITQCNGLDRLENWWDYFRGDIARPSIIISCNPQQTPNASLEGTASLGRLINTTILLYILQPGGNIEPVVASIPASTDGEGQYTFSELPLTLEGKTLVVEAQGGTFTDEATGQTLSMSGQSLFAVIPAVGTGRAVQVHITPFTDLAFRLARYRLENDPDASTAYQTGYYNWLVATTFELESNQGSTFGFKPFDIVSTVPANLYDETADVTTTSSTQYALALAGLSQQAADRNLSPIDWINQLVADAEDDGALNDIALTSADTLETAIDAFLAGPHNPFNTPTPTAPPSQTPTETPTHTPTDTPTATPMVTVTDTPTNTATHTFTPTYAPTATTASTPTPTPSPTSSTAQKFYLRGIGPNNNPPVLLLDTATPTATTAKYKDSTSVNFNGGNSWQEIGTWLATPVLTNGELTTLNDLHVWLGLKNSDDQGTRFDVRAEVYKNGTLIASGESHCIQGITRNANNALASSVAFAPFTAQDFNGFTDVLSLKVLTRIGTNGSGGFCGGHSNAVGLRLYFDAVNRQSQFDVISNP